MNSNLGWLEEGALRKRGQTQEEPDRETPELAYLVNSVIHCIRDLYFEKPHTLY